jgi:hypothetical protein
MVFPFQNRMSNRIRKILVFNKQISDVSYFDFRENDKELGYAHSDLDII